MNFSIVVRGQQLARVLRVAPLRRGGEPDEVDEQHRDQPALGHARTAEGHCLVDPRLARAGTDTGDQRSATVPAELGIGRVDRAADGARSAEPVAALDAEPAVGLVLRPAPGARDQRQGIVSCLNGVMSSAPRIRRVRQIRMLFSGPLRLFGRWSWDCQ